MNHSFGSGEPLTRMKTDFYMGTQRFSLVPIPRCVDLSGIPVVLMSVGFFCGLRLAGCAAVDHQDKVLCLA